MLFINAFTETFGGHNHLTIWTACLSGQGLNAPKVQISSAIMRK
jgi:hypothetical protein